MFKIATIFPFFAPLEQFQFISIWSVSETFSLLNNVNFILALNVVLIALLFTIFNSTLTNNYDYVVQTVYQLVVSIVKENLYIAKQQYFTLFFYLFLTILLANLIGLLPYSFTVTSSFIFTLFIAIFYFVAINTIAVHRHGWELNNLFLPSGAPLAIMPFLIFIELVSYIARVLSLSIRLFANMMSGHALLKILIGFAWSLLTCGSILFLISIFPWTIVTLVMFLELLIAFLQAYVFTLLVTLYTNDVLTFHD
jgi:ATP synthase subunit 6